MAPDLVTEVNQGVGDRKLIAAASREAVHAMLPPEIAVGFQAAQRGEEGRVTHASSEGRGVRVLGDEAEDGFF